VDEIAELDFRPEVRRLLLRDNAMRVFGLAD
jgi:predicted TIM-barrel fold metal-dependent hydrolase